VHDPQAHELGVLSAIAQQVGVVIENAMLYEEVQSLAALEERGRLSRELHDGLAQVLGYLHLKSKATSLLLASGRLKQAQLELEEMQQVAGETQQDVRESILGLRTTVPPGSSLIPTIVEYVHRFKGYNGPCTRVMVGEDVQLELSPLAEVQLLRIVQEALLNVRKHAGASRAWIRFEVEGERAVMTIEDNGQGFDLSHSKRARSGHFGLQTMKERAESVGAEFQIVTHTGQGTSVIVRLPVDDGGM
jgi:signal transduction histidine kinase